MGYANIETEEQAFIMEEANNEPTDGTQDPFTDGTDASDLSDPLPVVRPAPQAVAYQSHEEPVTESVQLPTVASQGLPDASDTNDAEDIA